MDAPSNPLTNRIGPLPVWAWAGIVVGAWWAYYLWTGRGKGGGTVAPADSTWIPTDSTSVDLSGQTGDASGLVFSPGLPTGGTPAPQTPQAWASIAADWLIGNGAPASVVQTALAKYIAGQPLTPQEQALVNQALQHFGTPPGGPIPVLTTPAPGPSAGPGYKYVVERHHVGVPTPVRLLITMWSDLSVLTNNNRETAVRLTAQDPANAKYLSYYKSHGGMFPGGNIVATFHVVKKA